MFAACMVLLGKQLPAAVCTFSDTDPLAISPDTVLSTISVTGVLGNASDVRVRLNNVQELSFALWEIDVLLVGPAGDQIILMSFACNNTGPISPLFSKSAVTVLPSSDIFDPACTSSTYFPADYHGQLQPPKYVLDSPPAPKPPPGGDYSGTLSGLVGKDASGTWKLYAASDSTDDNASLGGWQLLITADGCALFIDGFESGGTCAWSESVGGTVCP
jgi:hypothetical protein